MKLPTIKISQKANYIPFAVDVDFFELFKKIQRRFDTCFFFESLGGENGSSRYSLIGFDPEHIIRARDNDFIFDDVVYSVENPYKTLQEITPQNVISYRYSGGLIGYINYEAVNYFESELSLPTHPDFDQFIFGVYTDGLLLDKMTGEIFYFYYENNRHELFAELFSSPIADPGVVKIEFLEDTMTKEEHKIVVNKTKEYIEAGRVFQCEVGYKSKYKVEGDTMAIYQRLREVNPSPYMYYLQFGEKRIIGASPELLLEVVDKEMVTRPLAGSIRRGKDIDEDVSLARQLLNDKKERAEHMMLVDMHRNDIGRVAKFGTVKVRETMEIRKFSHVQHIESSIVGILHRGEDMFSALSSLLPGGVLSGAPKIEAIKIITENENEPRGPYGGALGYFGFNGDCTFAIPIRSLFLAGENGYTQTCSGIVIDSEPDKEFEEIARKLSAMKIVLESCANTLSKKSI
ncbi:MAG: anthranilate synthase component I [Candidatus Magasanikbacteria bacterium CG_4_10_14_0_2_um_filter_37_12]|uniref:Anthranilate synthase component I n=1 Tax=Candidatus Magasanikbacteria bacterium CG_4_10_14_0_2_um_filter_37_12 TaxID=1974637 RepID=A0A2M7V6U6_9BACT|nr:MAG: anthranilate synthase component I [Candidatus Magasanikbacteria bacterium CG_4_10_14_0_2_um_filter_37_12]